MEKKGKILLTLGFSRQAADLIDRALKRGQGSPELFLLYGDALRTQIGNRYGLYPPCQEGDPITQLAYRVNHSILDIWQRADLSDSEIHLLNEALVWYKKAVAQGGEGPAVMNRKGIVHAMLGNFDSARNYFEKAESKKPGPVYSTNLAIMHILNHEDDRGTALLLQGMSIHSKNPYFLDQCAGFYFLIRNDYEYALDLSGQALSANIHRDPLIFYHSYIIQKFLRRDRDAETIRALITSIDPCFEIVGE